MALKIETLLAAPTAAAEDGIYYVQTSPTSFDTYVVRNGVVRKQEGADVDTSEFVKNGVNGGDITVDTRQDINIGSTNSNPNINISGQEIQCNLSGSMDMKSGSAINIDCEVMGLYTTLESIYISSSEELRLKAQTGITIQPGDMREIQIMDRDNDKALGVFVEDDCNSHIASERSLFLESKNELILDSKNLIELVGGTNAILQASNGRVDINSYGTGSYSGVVVDSIATAKIGSQQGNVEISAPNKEVIIEGITSHIKGRNTSLSLYDDSTISMTSQSFDISSGDGHYIQFVTQPTDTRNKIISNRAIELTSETNNVWITGGNSYGGIFVVANKGDINIATNEQGRSINLDPSAGYIRIFGGELVFSAGSDRMVSGSEEMKQAFREWLEI